MEHPEESTQTQQERNDDLKNPASTEISTELTVEQALTQFTEFAIFMLTEDSGPDSEKPKLQKDTFISSCKEALTSTTEDPVTVLLQQASQLGLSQSQQIAFGREVGRSSEFKTNLRRNLLDKSDLESVLGWLYDKIPKTESQQQTEESPNQKFKQIIRQLTEFPDTDFPTRASSFLAERIPLASSYIEHNAFYFKKITRDDYRWLLSKIKI